MRNAVWFVDDLAGGIQAGIVLVVDGAQHQGADPLFIAGVLSAFKHQALSIGADWRALLAGAREMLEAGDQELIDRALRLSPGARIESQPQSVSA